jgi:hypothetical protein
MTSVVDRIGPAAATPPASFDLAAAKAELGIVGTAQDAAIQRVLDAALGMVETYLDRKLFHARETVTFHEVSARKLWVDRYPIDTVYAIDGNTPSVDLEVHRRNGWLIGPWGGRKVEVDYSGGYIVLPADLDYALWTVFHALWSSANQQTGNPGASASIAAGGLKSINITGVGSLTYDGGSSGGGAGVGAGQSGFAGLMPPQVISILDLYRRLSA